MAMTKENNQILPKDIKKRIYKSRKQRPCDNCRKRKSCCIIEDGIPCKLCKMFNKKCTFDKGPVYNNDKKKKEKQVQQQPINQNPSPNSSMSPSTPSNSFPGPTTMMMVKQEQQQEQLIPATCSNDDHMSLLDNNGYYNDYNFINHQQLYNHHHQMSSMNFGSNVNHNSVYDEVDGLNPNFENYLNNFPLDLDMNIDALNFQANFFDFSLEYEQMR